MKHLRIIVAVAALVLASAAFGPPLAAQEPQAQATPSAAAPWTP